MTAILKLGGSLLTDKSEPESIDEALLHDICDTIATTDPDLVLIHGGGSFGHPTAQAHGVSSTDPTTDPQAVWDIESAMRRFNTYVIEALIDHGVSPVPISPLAIGCSHQDGSVTIDITAIEAALNADFIPVLYGDVAAASGAGYAILSGDRQAIAIANAIDVSRIGFCADVPGVYDDAGTVIPEIRDIESIRSALGRPDGADVTGGIEAKIRALSRTSVPGAIFGRDDIEPFLEGALPGTRVGATPDSDNF